MACLSESFKGTKACFEREMPANCRAQVDAALRNRRR
jgi:hypothetical protein